MPSKVKAVSQSPQMLGMDGLTVEGASWQEDLRFDSNLDFLFGDQSTLANGSEDFQFDWDNVVATSPKHYHPLTPKQIPKSSNMPMQLPFLIDGIESRLEQKLFFHFTSHVSKILTLSTEPSNPFVSVIVPLAMRDQTIMRSMLSLAGSHLLNLEGRESDPELAHRNQRLHLMAVQGQSSHFQVFDAVDSSLSSQQVEIILTCSLLLCLYELCEGSGSGAWQGHLDAARRLVRKTVVTELESMHTNRNACATQTGGPLPRIDRFLVEFFIYHDSLATVTVFSEPVLKPQVYRDANPKFLAAHGSSAADGPYVVGVQDGLFDIIGPISALRTRAKKKLDGIVICEAVQIWQKLSEWQPPASADVEYGLIGSLYQWALFVWLFSVVYPNDITNTKVQLAVKEGLECLQQLEPTSGAMSCSLFPLFILGSSAVDLADRNGVLVEFQRLRSWSGLGNVSLALSVVQKMWSKYDNQEARSWDWVKESEEHGLVLLVT